MALSEKEVLSRREAVNFARKNSELEGIESVPELYELEERYARGEITEREFQQICIEKVREIAPNKNWVIELDELPED